MYSLFNDVGSSSVIVASLVVWLVDGLKRTQKGEVRAFFSTLARCSAQGQRKPPKYLSHDIRCPGRDFNRTLPRYKPKTLTSRVNLVGMFQFRSNFWNYITYTECPTRKPIFWEVIVSVIPSKNCICTHVLLRKIFEIELFHCTDLKLLLRNILPTVSDTGIYCSSEATP
jgi:hypothetical protein